MVAGEASLITCAPIGATRIKEQHNVHCFNSTFHTWWISALQPSSRHAVDEPLGRYWRGL